MSNLEHEWITDAPVAGGFVVGWLFTDAEAGRKTLRDFLVENERLRQAVETLVLRLERAPDETRAIDAHIAATKKR